MSGAPSIVARRWAAWWPVFLLALTIPVTAAVVAWLAAGAIRNERLASRQLRAEAAAESLRGAEKDLETRLRALLGRPRDRGSFIDLDARGQPVATAAGEDTGPVLQDEGWPAVRAAESAADWPAAARLAEGIAARAATDGERLLAVQTRVRCLLDAAQLEAASTAAAAGNATVDRPGPVESRLAAQTDLLLFEAGGTPREIAAARLIARLQHPGNGLPPALRRLLIRRLPAGSISTGPAELLVGEILDRGLATMPPGAREIPELDLVLVRPGVELAAVEHGTGERLFILPLREWQSLASSFGPDIRLTSSPATADTLASREAGPLLPGWRLDFVEKSAPATPALTRYAWGGSIGVLVLTGLTLFAAASVQRQLRRARLKEDLAATVSHELKTPLASMRLLVESLLEDDPPDPARTRDYLGLLAQENARLSRLVENFLTLSRLERGPNPLDLQPATAAGIVAEVTAALAPPVRDRLHTTVASDLPPLHARSDTLVAALLNLIDNAAKYSPEGTPILLQVGASAGKPSVTFSVTDHGPGLTPAEQRKIWQPFERLGRGPATPGCGLGLAIVRRVATQAGGTVEIQSTLGSGSTFHLHLPAAP